MSARALVLRLEGLAERLTEGNPNRARDLALAALIVVATGYMSLTAPERYPLLAAGIGVILVVTLMIANQEKTLYLVLWFSTVYLTLKATVLGWSDASLLLKDGSLLLLLGFWFFNFLMRSETLRMTPITRPIGVLVLWLLVQCFNPNTYGILSILQDLRFWLIPLAIFQLTVQLVNTREKVDRALRIVFTYAAIEAAYGCIQQLLPGDWLVALGANPDSYFYFYYGTKRSFSTMGTTAFALFAAMFPTICMFYRSQEVNPLRRAFFVVLMFVFLGGVVFTLVRTCWVAAIVTVTLYALVTRRYGLIVGLAGVGLLLMSLSTGYMRWKLEGLLNPIEDPSVQTRLEIVKLVSEGIVFRVFGYGLGTFAHNRYGMGEADKTGYGTATENWYLMTSLELGWIGIFILMWIWYKVYRLAWVNYKTLKTSRYRELSIALAGPLLAVEVARLGGPAGYFPPDSWHYWFFVGLLMMLPKADEELAAELAAAPVPPQRAANALGV